MSELVKTRRQIREETPSFTLQEIQAGGEELVVEIEKILNEKFLVLPDGLDKLEEMFIKELAEVNMGSLNDIQMFSDIISSVFARFKKENNL